MHDRIPLRHGVWALAAISCLVLFGLVSGIQAAPGAAADRELAEDLVERAGIRRGVCAVLGRDGNVALELARASELLVHVREPGDGAVAELRKEADAAGLGIGRLVVEQGRLDRLPFADNIIDIVVATRVSADGLQALSPDEMLRILRPGGIAIVGDAHTEGAESDARKLEQWARGSAAERVEARGDASGVWVQFHKPTLEGVDEWTHWEHGPDNNPVSTDKVIKAPYMTQFLANPLYIGMPSITTAAGGRTFLAIGHIAHHRREWETLYKLIARNGYNGTVLWKRELPEGYLVHRSAFIATKDTFYMIDGDHCLLLDPQTGKEKGEIRIPGVGKEWKWMVMKDGVLYVLAGEKGSGTKITKGDRTFGGWSWADLSPGYYTRPRVPFGFGKTLAAYDLQGKRLLWKHEEEKPIDSRSMAVGENRVFLYCPDQHLRSLNATTGKVVWTNSDSNVLDLIERPGKGLTSTPGFRTACMAVLTPEALIIQGQTRMNVIALSTRDGYLLWTKKKYTNNPNAIYVDGNVVLGVGRLGSHVAIDPVSGSVREDLKFRKVACTRLTASPDSFFCRGEGTLRFDRSSKKLLIDGAARPACNDGALPANGMLYIGPWQCDCNLSLIGCVGKCSAGDFRFDRVATDETRLQRGEGSVETVAPFSVSAEDWPTYRGNNQRGAATKTRVRAGQRITRRWEYTPDRPYLPTAPTSAGGLVFVSADDGKVRALDATNGKLRWEFATPCPVKSPPTIWEGRAYVGSGDGHVYALEAATGRLLWRFRAAPVERHIMVYDKLGSTWPVNSGVLVEDGVAYVAAGIIDHDGTHVYALDARTGKIKWQNNSSGHLSKELRKGVSVQGNLTIQGGRLLLAGGNQVSPAPFDLETGECPTDSFEQGQPKANGGSFVGVFGDGTAIAGGRVLYSAPENVSTKGSFVAFSGKRRFQLNFGGVPPAWDDRTVALVNFKHGKIMCCEADKLAERVKKGYPEANRGGADRRRVNLAAALVTDGGVRWQSDLGEPTKFEAISLAVCPNAVVAVVRYQQKFRSQPQWFAVAFNAQNGRPFLRHELDREPLPGGLLVDSSGRFIVTLLDGSVLCLGAG